MGNDAHSRLQEPARKGLIVVVDDDRAIRRLVRAWLEHAGFDVVDFPSGEAALAGLERLRPDAVCLDVSMPGLSGIETLQRLSEKHARTPVIMLTADTAVDTVVSAMSMGAYDYLAKPIGQTRLVQTLRNAVSHAKTVARLERLERDTFGYPGIVGSSESMQRLFRQMDRVAESDITALVHGESGSGKELVARAIHERSDRAGGPFVALNCAAIPETLQESELFGYEKGAFTGAGGRRIGRFEQANGGTLFLDEVGELSLTLQAKLLRVIQERVFHRVGGNAEVHSDFRLLTATHKSLRDLVDVGAFREDFYFRIAVFELEVPSLRERVEDIPALAQHFISRFAELAGREVRLSPTALDALLSYAWPGNVRELQNAIHRAIVSAADDTIRPRDLPTRVANLEGRIADSAPVLTPIPRPQTPPPVVSSAFRAPIRPHSNGELLSDHHLRVFHDDGTPMTMAEIEREAILMAVRRNDNNLTHVVRELGIGRTTLYRKLKRYNSE